jgi:hypothetical protein
VEAYDPNTGVELEQEFGASGNGGSSLVLQRNLVRSTFINHL